MRRHRLRFRRGNVLLETALIVPILAMLTFGAIEYSYAFYLKNTLQGAAREAARAAITPSATSGDVQAAADHVVSGVMPELVDKGSYKVTIDPADPDVDSGEWIQVSVECTWADGGIDVLPGSDMSISPERVIKATAVMRKE